MSLALFNDFRWQDGYGAFSIAQSQIEPTIAYIRGQAEPKEDKIACLVSLRSDVHDQDPQPEPPPSFVEPRRVQRLVAGMKGPAGEADGHGRGDPQFGEQVVSAAHLDMF